MANSFDQPVEPDVVVRARKGERDAHAALYAAFATPAHTLAWRVTARRDVAEEVLQETFVAVIRGIDGYRGDSAIGAWIRRIAVNKSLMHLRSAWRRKRDDKAGADVERCAAPESNDAVQLDLEVLLARLPETARAVVWLHDVEGYTHREIGKLMHRTPSFSKSQLARAHDRLRRSLAPERNTTEMKERCTPQSMTC